ncbi:penicillin-binding protein 1A [Desulfoferrobacter suflitae]|uniref:penicillin-binding protein 1A n=1 Tax=Desulfoferrobacter suflitae TaxID=2865782 RepID=UPI002164A225|nr:PBP1A family penicillin-binding protein [Desulfoferrobacter suflitae]MCK8601687.1 PBP1A family penicillin-binding protein [Desulfoferrobacter suflitae]
MPQPGPFRKAPQSSAARWLLSAAVGIVGLLSLAAGLAVFAFYIQLNRSLPSTESLKNYHPPLVSSVYARDGSLIGEFYTERRFLVSLDQISPHLIRAFLAAEDVRFYEHPGVDLQGIVRAFMKNLQAGEIVQGGSTITQQVVKSLLLTPERTWVRKLKEAMLAYRIDQSLSKDQILELYLNQIYFGSGAYGVEAAAQTYFNRHASDLSLAQATLLAGLPKAPSRFSPFQDLSAARERQKYVLQRMVEVGFISQQQADATYAEPLQLQQPRHWTLKNLNSFSEEVRRQIEQRYGRDGLYQEGLQIYTTLDPKAQTYAELALDRGLREIDKRHGYRKTNRRLNQERWPSFLAELKAVNRQLAEGKVLEALVVEYLRASKSYRVDFGNGQGILPPSGWEWTRVPSSRASKMFQPGDIISIRLEERQEEGVWRTSLDQTPGLQGAFLAIANDTGEVLCMVGGRDFERSQFNRVTQAVRQPGSAFKPIIYAAAIDKGFTEASILIDSPIVRDDPSLQGPWKPSNYDRKFWGPILLRKALIHSRNVVTVKLLDAIGIDYALSYARSLGITTPLTPTLSLALGASGVTLWELIGAYSAFAYQGERVTPFMISKVLDRNGNMLEEHQVQRESVISPQTAYVMTHLMQDVIQQGTGQRAKSLGRPAAGKTGTTNDLKDAWFIGYTPSYLAGAWVGYDNHNISLGRKETGGRAACPIWVYFMEEWLKDKPVEGFSIPPGVVFAKINPATGARASSGDPNAVYAAFLENHLPAERVSVPSESGPSQMTRSNSPSFFKSDLF